MKRLYLIPILLFIVFFAGNYGQDIVVVKDNDGNISVNPTDYVTLYDTTVIDDAIKFSDGTIMTTSVPYIFGAGFDGLTNATEESLTVSPNKWYYAVSFDSIAVISDTDDEDFELRICPVNEGAHTVIGTITTSTDLAGGRFHGSINTFTDGTIGRGEKIYLMVPLSSDWCDIFIYPTH